LHPQPHSAITMLGAATTKMSSVSNSFFIIALL
jgi:hypothetical protein